MYKISRRKFIELTAVLPACAVLPSITVLPPTPLSGPRSLTMLEDVVIYTDGPVGSVPIPPRYYEARQTYMEFVSESPDAWVQMPEDHVDNGFFDVFIESGLAEEILA